MQITVSPSRYWLLAPLVALGGAVWFCIYYLTNSYERLLTDFRAAHGCFYRSEVFAESYFSPAVKAAGNGWCAAGLGLSVGALLALIFYFFKKPVWHFRIAISKKDLWAVVALWVVALATWLWGAVRALPAYDEVFSAINIAGKGPALAIRYYMLPNNHTLFNTLNGLLPGNGGDKVFTGRLLSGFVHLGTTAVLYCWMRCRSLSVGWAFCCTAVVLLFYPVWAFSFQARGYAIYLFCCWMAIVSLDSYFKRKDNLLLLVHLLASFTGFAVVPAYLYWQLGMGIYALTYLSLFHKNRALFIRFIGAQGILVAAVFLFYLPGIATSGLAAYTQNPYITPAADTFGAFFKIFLVAMDSTIRYSFASDVDGKSGVYIIAFFLPLLAWPFCKSEEGRRAIIQFFIFWGVFCLVQLGVTRRWPFMRNMVAHSSLFCAVFLVVFYHAAHTIFQRIRQLQLLPGVLTALLLLVTAVHYVRFMTNHLNDIYYNFLDKSFQEPHNLVIQIPLRARVWYSDESFFPHFLLRQRGTVASHCTDEAPYDYFILNHRQETLPGTFKKELVKEVFKGQKYILYKNITPH